MPLSPHVSFLYQIRVETKMYFIPRILVAVYLFSSLTSICFLIVIEYISTSTCTKCLRCNVNMSVLNCTCNFGLEHYFLKCICQQIFCNLLVCVLLCSSPVSFLFKLK